MRVYVEGRGLRGRLIRRHLWISEVVFAFEFRPSLSGCSSLGSISQPPIGEIPVEF